MPRHLTFLLLAGFVALSACRSKPKKKDAELPVEPARGGHSGKVTIRSVEPESETRKATAGRAKPKTGAPETAQPIPPVEPKPPLVAKPANSPVPPPVPHVPSPTKAAEDATGAPPSAPAKASSVKPPIQPSATSPATPAELVTPPPTVKSVPPLAPPSASPPPESLSAPARTAKPTDGRAIELGVPSKPQAQTTTPEPLRTTVPATSAQTKPATVGPMLGLLGTDPRPRVGDPRNLPLPNGSGGSPNGTPHSPLALPDGPGTNHPPATNAALKAIGVDPLLQGAAWREQQLARQAAEQKAREEEQQKLKGALYRFLFKGGTNQ